MENTRQCIELADIFSHHANEFLQGHKLCPEQHKAYEAIVKCRTSALGGHIDQCDNCGYTRHSYNSCGNRHCPKCQYIRKAKWVDKLAGNLPAVKYFHLVFTIPPCLHKLFYINQQTAYGLLFKAAGESVLQCAKKTKYLGAQVGAVAILHTWGQTLVYHPHIHMIVPAGGLSEDEMEWVATDKKFFLPVKILSAVFRGILCKLLEKGVSESKINLPQSNLDFFSIRHECYKKKWVVYCQKPFSGPENLINYLGNYTHRVAISNQRLVAHEQGRVSFTYKDYKLAGTRKDITLGAQEFIRRFLQHVLPKGFCKIRYFGFMAMCNMKEKLETCLGLIKTSSFLPVLEGLSAVEVFRQITGIDLICCPKCKSGKMRPILALENNCNSPGQ
jgi:hypothetical protein